MTREEKAWKRMCGGKPARKPALPKVLMPKSEYLPAPPENHSPRNTDPRWQWKKVRQGGYVEFLRQNGLLNQARLDAHFAACERRSHTGPTDHAVTTRLATGVETGVSSPHLEPAPSLGSQPQALKAA